MLAREWLRRRSMPVDRPAGPPNPFEACGLGACIVVGFTAVLGVAQPSSFEHTLPPWGQRVWGALMLIGGLASVAGLYWPADPVDGVLIKRVGLVTLCPLLIAYGGAGFLTEPATRLVAASFAVALGLACAFRTRQVTVAIRGLHGRLRGLREEWENGHDP
jgi:hypothetical protein